MAHAAQVHVDIDVIFKALRLVPDFDGNPHILTRFINLCDQLVITYFIPEPGHDLSNQALLNGILNKVTGSAARLINANGIPDTWQGIRSALINNFADHRDETALYSDLSMQTQGSNTPQEFYERCLNLFSTIMTYVSLHEQLPSTINAKRDLYKKLTLQAYLRGLKDPLGCRIRCMRPDSIEKALEYVQDEMNTLYIQQRNEGGSNKGHQQPHMQNQVTPRSTHFGLSMRPTGFNLPMPGPPHYQYMHGWRPSFPSQAQQPRGLTRTQQIMRGLPQGPQQNRFQIPNQTGQSLNNSARPMSGVSHFVPRVLPPTPRPFSAQNSHDWRRFGNPSPSNYFKTREVNFNEFDDYDYYNCDDSSDLNTYDYYPYYTYDNPYPETTASVEELDQPTPETENFHQESSSEKPK